MYTFWLSFNLFIGEEIDEKPKEANPDVSIDRDEPLLRVGSDSLFCLCLQLKFQMIEM